MGFYRNLIMSDLPDRFSIINDTDPCWPEWYMERGLIQDHCRDVLQGSYDIPYSPEKPPIILDIGANIGAFTRWAVKRWPGCIIHAYEPEPNNFKLLTATAQATDTLNCIHLYQLAVSDRPGKAKLFNMAFNCGEFSLFKQDSDREPKGIVEVDLIPAKDLPKANILKLDCEGAEGGILNNLYESERLQEFDAIMLEYHNAQDGEMICTGLLGQGYELTGENIKAQHRGELQFVKKDLLPK